MSENKPKLLIVEDDLGLQKQLKWSYEDFHVFTASNRQEAMALLRSEDCRLIQMAFQKDLRRWMKC
jgi:two-component system, NtrC family, response regulator